MLLVRGDKHPTEIEGARECVRVHGTTFGRAREDGAVRGESACDDRERERVCEALRGEERGCMVITLRGECDEHCEK